MLSRVLILTVLACVATAELMLDQSPSPMPHRMKMLNRQPNAYHGHHVHHHNKHYNHRPTKIVALDEIIKKKHPVEFLGRQFIQNQLKAQKGEYKFLRLSGKEQHDVNGTIALNKQGVVVNVNEMKDGNFLVQDAQNRVVGAVDMHGQSYKHIDSHKTPTGNSYTNAVHTGKANLNIEMDLPQKRNSHAPIKHMQARVYQNYNSRANIQVNPVRSHPQYYVRPAPAYQQPQHYRYRREAEINDVPCNNPNQCDPKTNKLFQNITQKLKDFGKKMKMSVCKMLIKASKDDKDVHVEMEGKPQEQAQDSPVANQEDVKKVKNFFAKIGQKLKNAFKGTAKNLMIKAKCNQTEGQPQDTKTVKLDSGNDAAPVTEQGHITTGPETSENIVIVDNQ